MNESIDNNAGMPSEQGAALTMPEDLRRELAHLNFLIEESCTGQATSMTRSWADRIAALTLERDTLKAENAQWATWCIVEIAVRNPSVAEYMDHWEGRATKAEAKVERLSAPVSDARRETLELAAEWLRHNKIERVEREVLLIRPGTITEADKAWADALIAARASTPPAPINDDEQRRKDAGWNDRPKARCICGEMIAWYSGEYLHVAGRSGLCDDGRLASPAHFLVGRAPAEPEWKKGQP